MDAYDPRHVPDPDEWLGMDEMERYRLVREHHREAGVDLPNERLHAMLHTVVENQLAMDDPPEAREAFQRVREEGLSRHEAIHAVASALATTMWWTLGDEEGAVAGDLNEEYVGALNELSVESWRAGFE